MENVWRSSHKNEEDRMGLIVSARILSFLVIWRVHGCMVCILWRHCWDRGSIPYELACVYMCNDDDTVTSLHTTSDVRTDRGILFSWFPIVLKYIFCLIFVRNGVKMGVLWKNGWWNSYYNELGRDNLLLWDDISWSFIICTGLVALVCHILYGNTFFASFSC